MDDVTLEALISALAMSPDNKILRVQVVRELLRSRRWLKAEEMAKPLLESGEKALALLAAARGALERGDRGEAGRFYRAALDLDRSLVDEALEAELEVDDQPARLSVHLPQEESAPGADRRERITFQDVGGMDSLKEQVRLNILYPLQKPEIYAAYGKKVGGGILMFGPPGCGKTYLSRATAGEIGAHFYTLSLNDVVSMWVGETEKHLAALFETARTNAPSVIFVDEVDALGGKRSDMCATTRRMVSQLLVEMDGIASKNEKVLVLGATNMPWNVDAALRRPGRFDRVLFVPPPDLKAREEILKVSSRGRKLENEINWVDLAKKTELFSGADLNNLVERATERALSDALKSGTLRDVTRSDFLAALKECRPSTTEWLRRSKNYVAFANQEGLYDDLARYLQEVRLT